MANFLGSITNPKPAPVQQVPADPNWPAWFYHPDGRSKCCKNEREALQLCNPEDGWGPRPFPPPAPASVAVSAGDVQTKIDAAVKAAIADQKVRDEEFRKKAKSEYKTLDAAFNSLQVKNDSLVRENKELQELVVQLRAQLAAYSKPAEPAQPTPAANEMDDLFSDKG